MSTVPASLRDLGAYWVARGGVNLGVVGNTRHCKGYHLGRDRIYGSCACLIDGECRAGLGANDYSLRTARDRNGLTNAASAIDLGRLNGSLVQLRAFSIWLVGRCRANASGTSDVREITYTPDGKTVYGYSREAGLASAPIPGYGDLSHLTHTHISFYRDSEARDKRPLFRPFFELAPPDTSVEDPMAEFIAAGGLTLASNFAIDLPKGTTLYRSEGVPGPTTLSAAATLDYLGQTGGYYFVLVSTAAFYPDGVQRPTQVLVKPAEFTARPRPKTVAELAATASRYGADDTPFDQDDIDAAVADLRADLAAATEAVVTAQTAAGNAAGMERERIAAAEAARIRAL